MPTTLAISVLERTLEQETALAVSLIVALIVLLVAFRAQVRDLVNEKLTMVHRSESKLLEVTTAMSAEIQLQPLLHMVMESVTEILDADRSTLFLHDARSGELWANVAQGVDVEQIRFPSSIGIAGSVFTTGKTINIKEAYSDERFNRAVDKKTGYRTRSILCMRVNSKTGKAIGVVQVLNKNNGTFRKIDERRLQAFSAQAAIAIENAQLFEDVVNIKNYNEAILESMKSGVVSFDAEGTITKANRASLALFQLADSDALLGAQAKSLFAGSNAWLAQTIEQTLVTGNSDYVPDSSLHLPLSAAESGNKEIAAHVTTHALNNAKGGRIGGLLIIEDITTERRLRTTMARYMTKEVADKLLEEGEAALGGTLQPATILFSDIRAFTSFSERAGPQESVQLLNDYFTIMFDVVVSHQGILDKYIGDAILAVYGALFSTPEDADNALRSAIEMTAALRRFNTERVGAGKEPIEIGIGINTGEVVSGNIGSRKRMDYTVIGDGVNLAARLESATKTYGSRILISESTCGELQSDYLLREVDRIRVQGKKQPVAIFEVLDALDEGAIPDVPAFLAQSQEALAAYRAQDWDTASHHFKTLSTIRLDDRVSSLYLERCKHFAANSPGPNWDGVWVMTTK